MSDNDVVEQVRDRYAVAAKAAMGTGRRTVDILDDLDGGGSGCCGGDGCKPNVPGAVFGAGLYDQEQAGEVPDGAVSASLGCGNPTAVADLRPGERVLDLGSGGGLDVLLSARRVGPSGFAYGVDMTDEMLALARDNAAKSDATNVEFLKGRIEQVPLPDGAVDVVISNCVINLSVDKPKVLAEMFRVLSPGGRVGVSDVVAEDHLTPAERSERGSLVGCIAGALSRQEYVDGLAAAGFTGIEVRFTQEVAPQLHGAIIRATKPVLAPIIRVFEGPLCCNTGVCGPDPAQALVDFTADARWAADQGANLTRANLAQDPAAFASDPLASAFLRTASAEALPLVTVDGVTVLTGRYPTRSELARYARLPVAEASEESAPAPCCGGESAESGCRTPAAVTLQVTTPGQACCPDAQ